MPMLVTKSKIKEILKHKIERDMLEKVNKRGNLSKREFLFFFVISFSYK